MTPSSPVHSRPRVYDVAVIGGGIIGCAAAAFLAEAGLEVILVERTEIAAGASGRNSGAIQRPFDAALADLHAESLLLYREMAARDADFDFAPAPAGLLLLSADGHEVELAAAAIARTAPDLEPQVLDPAALAAAEPGLARDLVACRLETAYPVAPAAATTAFARRARRAGVDVRLGAGDVEVVVEGERVIGVTQPGGVGIRCATVLVAAGPWTPALVPGWSDAPPIRSVWGVVVGVELAHPPGHVLEELGIDRPGDPPHELFSMVTAANSTGVGSTFLAQRPDPQVTAGRVLERARLFVPGLRDAHALSVRVCARPVSFDGRPLIGRVPGIDGLFVCAGHGPWGISTGPASARHVADAILDRSEIAAPFSVGRMVSVTRPRHQAPRT